jgi:hypothetical protein
MAGPVGNGMGIGAFYNQALQKDFSRDHQMRVINIGPGGFIKKEDNVYITTSVLPGYAIANQAVPFMGLQFNVPGSGNFPGSDAWAVTFRCDAQLNIREKIIGWQKAVFNAFPDEATNSVGAYGPKGIDTYADLAVFDRDGVTVRGVKLIGCYPTLVGEIAYDATANGNVVTMNVTLAYQWWTNQNAFSGQVVP